MTWARYPKVVLLQFALATGVAPWVLAGVLADRVVVAVDGSAELGLDGDAVRRAIGDELGAPVVAPSDPKAAGVASVLLVAADRTTIRMTLRSGEGRVTTRAITASPDRAARLRDVAWLAGNLLRDQVSPIVGLPPPEPSKPAAVIEPPPAPAPRGVAVVAARAAPRSSTPRPQLAIAVLSGPAFAPNQEGNLYSATAQVDVQRRSASRGLVLGMALQLGHNLTGDTVHLFGLDVFGGKEWRGPNGFGELTAGIGVEAARPLNGASYNCTDPCVLTNVRPPDVTAIPFVRFVATAGVAITSRLDLALRVSAQFSGDGILDSTASATAGIRWRVN